MGTTTRGNTLSITERLRRVYLPCPANNGNKAVAIKVFDKHNLISEMISSQDMVTELQNFLNGMGASPGLPTDIAANLSSLRFTVDYEPRAPGREEIERFGVTDFPVHLLTASGLVTSSSRDIVGLMEAHRIPEETRVAERPQPGEEGINMFRVFPYRTVEDDWEENRTVLGIGVPGTYFTNNQTRCRKVGIIKMQGFMTENLPMARRPEKILFVLKHELGHMFALRHQENTIMNPGYDVNPASRYTNDQLFIVSRSLDSLIQP